ncbi:hypothetical protein Ga0080574_TMP1322 [Salipiger abyssi]|uniref:Uncharacterized protein n=1 Tax=Salipiger abyssi TaxID=1250539 RepID=A0A1P8UQJ1_9RHOB|nr:hypothetical protein Ga0080574_TMP1322 [Salipiger abyssi]
MGSCSWCQAARLWASPCRAATALETQNDRAVGNRAVGV